MISSIGLGQSSWIRKATSTSKPLYAIKFRTIDDGWAVGSSGTVLHTTNGGEAWKADSVEYLGVRPLLSFVEPQDSLNIWAGRWSAPTFRSTDGGQTWAYRLIDSVANISKIFFLNPSLGFAAGTERSDDYSGRILRTTDGGATWEAIYDVPYRAFYDVFFVDSLFGVAVGGTSPPFNNFDSETIHRTTDGGVTWSEVAAPGSGPLSSVAFSDHGAGWASGDNAHLIVSTDSGITWMQKGLSIGSNAPLHSLATPRQSDVWVTVASAESLFHSNDAGQTWKPESLGLAVFSVFFSDPSLGWAVGDSGTVWKYDLPTSMSDPPARAISFHLFNNYPNPFNPSTLIRFSLSTGSYASLRVYDLLGRMIATLVEGRLSAGEHEFLFNGEGLPSGAYICTLNTQDQSKSAKMILSK